MNLTKVAVERQLRAMGAEEYMLGVFERSVDKMRNVRCMGVDGVLRRMSWLRAMNAGGCDIYIRPAGDQHDLVLVDDLEYESIEQMIADGLRAAALVETSRENYQAWIRVGEAQDKDTRRAVARVLAAKYGGDVGAANGAQYGRLAGFTNRKDKYIDKYGRSPWVMIRDWRGEVIGTEVAVGLISNAHALLVDVVHSSAERGGAWAGLDITDCFLDADQSQPTAAQLKRPARAAYEGAMRYTMNAAGRRGEDIDIHVCDWRVCVELVKKGYSPAEVADAMLHTSPDLHKRKRGGHAIKYVRQTVSKSFAMFGSNPFSAAPRRCSSSAPLAEDTAQPVRGPSPG